MQGIRRRQRRTAAVWLLMLGLSFAPSLALAAAACATACCPVEGEREDCGDGFSSRACCATAPTPLASIASIASTAVETPSLPTLPLRDVVVSPERRDARWRFAEAERSLRASPLRLSVVLLI